MNRARHPEWVALGGAVMLCWSAAASADPFSGLATAVSDYQFRGLDRTDGPALQGEADYVRSDGLYAGAWASNARAAGGSEVDTYGGWSGAFTLRELYPVRVDAGAIGYLFPGDEAAAGARHNLDFVEVYAGARLGPVSAKAYLSPDYADAGGPALSLRGTLHWPFNHQFSAKIQGGLNGGPGLRNYTARLTRDQRGSNYFDYSALLEYALPADFTAAAGVAGTTLDLADGRGRSGSQPKLLLEFSKRFDF